MNRQTKTLQKYARPATSSSAGFHVAELAVALVVIVVVGFVGYKVAGAPRHDETSGQSTTVKQANKNVVPDDVRWNMTNDGSWTADGKPPACPDPILSRSPVDVTRASAVMLPGQYRGTHYKAHGGFRFDHQSDASADVYLPLNARLASMTQYLEQGQVQYILGFENPCGMQIRFDHLLTLTPEFAAIAKTLPAPTEDTRSAPPQTPPAYSKKIYNAGMHIATAVGHTTPQLSVGFDFGVYDIRRPNEISKNSTWAKLHKNESNQNFYGLCWLDMLPAPDVERVYQILPLNNDDRGASDYCSRDEGGSTLDYNNGQPILNHSTSNIAR